MNIVNQKIGEDMQTTPTVTDIRTLTALRHASPENLYFLVVTVNGEDRVAICCKQKNAEEQIRVLAYLPKKEDEVLVQPLLLISEDKKSVN